MSEFEVNMNIAGSSAKRVLIGNSQHQGARPYQEDSFGFTGLDESTVTEKGFIAVVADGMGGLTDSRQISSFAVSAISEGFKAFDFSKPIPLLLSQLAQSVNSRAAAANTGGGSTLAAVYCHPGGLYWCSAGDSRIYLLRKGRLYQMNEDKDLFTDLLDRVLDGGLTLEEAEDDERKTALTEYIGQDKPLSPEINPHPFIPETGDVILICSDGVYNALEEDELTRILDTAPQFAADRIVKKVLEKRYSNQDNFTSVILKFV